MADNIHGEQQQVTKCLRNDYDGECDVQVSSQLSYVQLYTIVDEGYYEPEK